MPLPKIIIVDDHDIFRDGLVSLLTYKKIGKVIADVSNGQEFLKILKKENPDIVLMDISMPIMDGYTATIEALKIKPGINILTLSMFDNENYYQKMISAGVKGFIPKSAGKNELAKAINTVSEGKCYFSNELLRKTIVKLSKKKSQNSSKKTMTNREIEVLGLMCNGLTAKEIATKIGLSKKTVEGYRTSLFSKTQTNNSVALVIYAIKNELVEI